MNHPPSQAEAVPGIYLFTEPQESDGIGLSPEAARAIHTAGPGNDK